MFVLHSYRYDDEEYLELDPLTGERGVGSYNPDEHYSTAGTSPGSAAYYGASPGGGSAGSSRASDRLPRDSSTPVITPRSIFYLQGKEVDYDRFFSIHAGIILT